MWLVSKCTVRDSCSRSVGSLYEALGAGCCIYCWVCRFLFWHEQRWGTDGPTLIHPSQQTLSFLSAGSERRQREAPWFISLRLKREDCAMCAPRRILAESLLWAEASAAAGLSVSHKASVGQRYFSSVWQPAAVNIHKDVKENNSLHRMVLIWPAWVWFEHKLWGIWPVGGVWMKNPRNNTLSHPKHTCTSVCASGTAVHGQ